MPLTRKSAYKKLGLAVNAGETATRAAYKTLALRYHPDKAPEEARKEATSNFQEIQTAYEYCLNSLHYATCEDEPEHSNAAGSDDEVKEGTVDWRGKLPNGVGGWGVRWWENLAGNEPEAIQQWAKAQEKAERDARLKLSAANRKKVNAEYQAAYEQFEKWRREHIEKRNQEEQLQHNINTSEPRLRDHVRAELAKKRCAPGYKYDDGYQEVVDEEVYFDEPEPDAIYLSEQLCAWRIHHKATRANRISPQQRLDQFRAQVAALEARPVTEELEAQPEWSKKQKAKYRKQTERQLMEEVRIAAEMKPVTSVPKTLADAHGRSKQWWKRVDQVAC